VIEVLRAPNPGPMTLDGTNTYVVQARGGAIVVDPGPAVDRHLEAVAALGPVRAIVLTHGHPDHSAGAPRLAALTGAPVLARDPVYGDPLPEEVAATLRVIDTPGHTADSVSLLVGDALLTGDTVLGRGTSVVAHPDGRLGDYLDSLRMLRRLVDTAPVRRILPGHGPEVGTPAEVLDVYLEHRRERLAQVRAALAAGARTPAEVVARVYADVDRGLWPAAELSVRAQLEHLAGSTDA
jgi:glyoxylase-like metal-dependent hydrolase (beta-lactamase superfamily II)